MDADTAFETVGEAPVSGDTAGAETVFETRAESRQGLRSWLEEGADADDSDAFARSADESPIDDGGTDAEPADRAEPSELEAARREAAQHRRLAEQYAPLSDRLGRLSDEGREGLMYLAELYSVNPERAAYELAQSFGLDLTSVDEPQITQADIEYMLDQREAAQEHAAATEEHRVGIRGAAQQLGYTPDSEEYGTLLSVASSLFMQDEHGNVRDPEEALELAHHALTRRATAANPPVEPAALSRREARDAFSASL